MPKPFVTDGGMETGLALVRLFTERWGAQVTDYDATVEGDVVVDLVLPMDSGAMMRDRSKALTRQNRRHITHLRERIDSVNAFVSRMWVPLPRAGEDLRAAS